MDLESDEHSLMGAVAKAWGVALEGLEPTRGGLDADAQTFRGKTRDGRAYFLKLRGTPSEGAALTATLREAGLGAALAPLPTRSGAACLDTSRGFLYLYPFVEGHNGLERPLGLPQWRAFGAAVRQIHDFPPPELPTEDFRLTRADAFDALAEDP